MTKYILLPLLLIILGCETASVDSGSEQKEEYDLVYDLDKLNSPPKIMFMRSPIYPDELIQKEIEGDVLLEFIITENGSVANIKVLESDHILFSEAARAAVKDAKYRPGIYEWKPVACRMRLPIPFRIRY